MSKRNRLRADFGRGYIAMPMKNIGSLKNVLSRIADPSARKCVIMSMWERRELTAQDTEYLIRALGLEGA